VKVYVAVQMIVRFVVAYFGLDLVTIVTYTIKQMNVVVRHYFVNYL